MTNLTAVRRTFVSLDDSSRRDWMVIGAETVENQNQAAERVMTMLQSLVEVVDSFPVDQLTHCLQTATRAERAGADDELVVASLCHDIGKAVSIPNHPGIAAEILRPYVRPEITAIIAAHQDFEGKHYYRHIGLDPDVRGRYRNEAWYGLAEQFADEWDQKSFDPNYPTQPLSHFGPKVRAIFGVPHML